MHRSRVLGSVPPGSRLASRTVPRRVCLSTLADALAAVPRQLGQLYRRARDQHPERWSGSIRDWSPIGPVTLNPTGRAPAQVLQSA
ncbi:MAG: hypothetical protein BRC37_03225 [Cyanobacteria bacterium QH_3_48_40]|nr:MAG: hypothetical protein BRC37_03225 [Cyanobacteria bacterium QH_3_48_40]